MKKKLLILVVILFCIFVALGLFSIIKQKNSSNNSKITNDILVKTTYNYPLREVLKVQDDGTIYKSKIIDELTADGAPKDEFNKSGVVSKEDLKEIKDIIDIMKNEVKKEENFSKDYGLAVNIGENMLYGCEYFSQKEVDKLNNIIEKYE